MNQGVLGLCKILLGDVDEAVIWLRKARAANPRLFYIHAFLAAALALRDELDEAGDALRQAVMIRPEFGSKSDLDAVLRESSPQYSLLGEDGLCWPHSGRSPVARSRFRSPAR